MPNKPKRRIMRSFKMSEISAVDSPAQEGAGALLMKRNGIEKGYSDLVDIFTSSADGHQHGVRFAVYEDGTSRIEVSYAAGEDGESHDHQVMRSSDGSLVLSENQGHTHTLDADALQRALISMTVGKSSDAENIGNQPTEDGMTQKATSSDAAGDQSAEIKKRDDEIARLNAIVSMTPEHRAHYDALSSEARRADFLKMDIGQREDVLEQAEKANPVGWHSAMSWLGSKAKSSCCMIAIS